MEFLLDTNIVIFIFRGHENLMKNILKNNIRNCAISEITLVELRVGAEKSLRKNFQNNLINEFLKDVIILPISNSIAVFAEEKVRLDKSGNRIDDFDLFIGSTAVAHNLTLITNNLKHFERIQNLEILDWTI